VGHWHRLGGDEPHRRADGGRHDLVNGFNSGGDPGHLRVGQAVAAGKGTGGVSGLMLFRPLAHMLYAQAALFLIAFCARAGIHISASM